MKFKPVARAVPELVKGLLALLLLVFVCACHPENPENPDRNPYGGKPEQEDFVISEGTTVYGTVTCSGKGVSGVAVSDGSVVTVTDGDGRYELESSKRLGYVFISVPSGYEVPSDGVKPRFYCDCKQGAKVPERADFTLDEVDQTGCSVLFFGDMHLADRKFCSDLAQFREFTADVNGYINDHKDRKVYAVTLGDMAWDYFWTANNYNLSSYLADMNREFRGLQVFQTMGNHDNDPSFSGDIPASSTFRKILGPTYYSFNIGEAHFIVLDDIVYLDGKERTFYKEVSVDQLSWLQKDLALVSRKTPVFVMMHAPLYTSSGGSSLYNLWDTISLFDGFDRVQFVTGHTHVIYNIDALKRSIHVYENNSGAVCGAWWMPGYIQPGLHMSGDGSPGGYRVVEFSGPEFTWYFKGTGRPADYQFRTYDRNEICLSAEKYVPGATAENKAAFLESVGDYAKQSSGNYVYLNIWDYDPSWKISVKENGRTLRWTQFTAKEPLYLATYEAEEYNLGYSVSYPGGTTSHLFQVQASAPDTPLEITVTDRFGRVYTETMTRPKKFTFDNYR